GQAPVQLAAATSTRDILTTLSQGAPPALLVIDSIQTMHSDLIEGAPGTVSQVRASAQELIRFAKERGTALVLVGHVTKDGSIAGPRVLEHLVDVVLHFEGERSSRLRMVRAIKNRFGPVDEVGCFDLSAQGIVAITDPTGLFIESHHGPVPGTCIAVTMEGRRPMLAEVQALVTATSSERPRRTTSGVDSSRVAMILAVLQQHAGLRLHHHDIFVSSVGGAKLTEPSNDLAIALAIVSASRGVPLDRKFVAVGEIGLSGEIRRVRDVPLRLAEAARLGSRRAAAPCERDDKPGESKVVDGLRVLGVDHLGRLLPILELIEDTDSKTRSLS
ncbi:MAG: DNA repair protein RadA, partial [Propionibacteriaceae bacterium]